MHACALPPLSELYTEHRPRALAIARRIVGDTADAEDVVQDVFAGSLAAPPATAAARRGAPGCTGSW